MRSKQVSQVLLAVQFKAEGHDLARETIASKQCLHAVSLDFSVEHVT